MWKTVAYLSNWILLWNVYTFGTDSNNSSNMASNLVKNTFASLLNIGGQPTTAGQGTPRKLHCKGVVVESTDKCIFCPNSEVRNRWL